MGCRQASATCDGQAVGISSQQRPMMAGIRVGACSTCPDSSGVAGQVRNYLIDSVNRTPVQLDELGAAQHLANVYGRGVGRRLPADAVELGIQGSCRRANLAFGNHARSGNIGVRNANPVPINTETALLAKRKGCFLPRCGCSNA